MSPKTRGRGSGGWVAGFSLIAAVGISAGLGLTSEGLGLAEPLQASTDPSTDGATLQVPFDFYRQNVEPLFLRPRGYPGSTDGNAACVMCHVWQTSVRFSLEEPTETLDGGAWTEEQSRRNYEVVTQLVNASDPESSRFLLKPLAEVAGGAASHGRQLLGFYSGPRVSSRTRLDPYPPGGGVHACRRNGGRRLPVLSQLCPPECAQCREIRAAPVHVVSCRRLGRVRPGRRQRWRVDGGRSPTGIRDAPETDRAWRSRAESLPAEAPAPGRWRCVCPQRREAVADPK